MTPEKEYGCGIGRSSGSQNEVFHDNGLAENDWMLGSEWNCEVSNHNLELEPGGLIVSTQSVVSLSGEHKLKQFCDTILHSPVDFSIPASRAGKIWRLAVDTSRPAPDDFSDPGKEPSMQGQIGLRLEPRSSAILLTDDGEAPHDN